MLQVTLKARKQHFADKHPEQDGRLALVRALGSARAVGWRDTIRTTTANAQLARRVRAWKLGELVHPRCFSLPYSTPERMGASIQFCPDCGRLANGIGPLQRFPCTLPEKRILRIRHLRWRMLRKWQKQLALFGPWPSWYDPARLRIAFERLVAFETSLPPHIAAWPARPQQSGHAGLLLDPFLHG